MASPLCTVKDGAGAATVTTNGNNVTPGNTVTIQLTSQAGVSSWSISCVNTDDLSNASTVTSALTIDNLNKLATFTAPVAGRAYMFKSQINGGLNLATGAVDATTSYTFVVYTLTTGGVRVICANETTEGNPTAGWTAPINAVIRNPSGTIPTGTGIPHIVGGVQNAAASTIVDADVSASAAVAVSKLAPSGTNGWVLTTTAGVPVWAAASGGGTPTGTGIPHIVGGVQQAASSLIVDADVSAVGAAKITGVLALANGGTNASTGLTTANGVVTSSGTALQQATNVLAGANFLSVGATPAATGALRIPNNQYLFAKDIGATDRQIIGIDGSNYLSLGPTGFFQCLIGGDDLILTTSAGQIMRGGFNAPMVISDGTSGTTNGLYQYNATLNADFSNTAATFQSSNLSISVASNESWDVTFDFLTTTATAVTMQIGILCPVGATISGVGFASNATLPSASSTVSQINAFTAVGGTTGGVFTLGGSAGRVDGGRLTVSVVMGVNAGQIALQSKSGTAATAVKILRGSKMVAKRSNLV